MNRQVQEIYSNIEVTARKYPGLVRLDNGVAEKWIQKAEQKLDLKFPPSFRYFLSQYAGGNIGGEEILGLADFEPEPDAPALDFVYCTLCERRDGWINKYYILLVNNDGDQEFYIDTEIRDSTGECPVVELNIEDRNSPKIYALNFAEFLLKRIVFRCQHSDH